MFIKIITSLLFLLIIKISTFGLCIQNTDNSNNDQDRNNQQNILRNSADHKESVLDSTSKFLFPSQTNLDSLSSQNTNTILHNNLANTNKYNSILNRGEYLQNNDNNYNSNDNKNNNYYYSTNNLNRQDVPNYLTSTNVVNNHGYVHNYNHLNNHNKPYYNPNPRPTPPPILPITDDIIYGQQQSVLQNHPSSSSSSSLHDQQHFTHNNVGGQFLNFNPFRNILGLFGTPSLPLSNQFNKALYGIANNDELQCVPRLICQVIGDPNRRNELPSFFTAPYMATLISALPETSPLLMFAKAAALGLTGGESSCHNIYSKCPKDEDELLLYLNNHRGGFFKFFSGNNTYYGNNDFNNHNSHGNQQYNDDSEQSQNSNKYQFSILDTGLKTASTIGQFITNLFSGITTTNQPNYYRHYRNTRPHPIESKRMHINCQVNFQNPLCSLNKIKNNNNIKKNINEAVNIEGRILNAKQQQQYFNYLPKLTFPIDETNDYHNSHSHQDYRDEKRIRFSNNHHGEEQLHTSNKMIFPDRTGTGNLRFDSENFNFNYPNNVDKERIDFSRIVNKPNKYGSNVQQNYNFSENNQYYQNNQNSQTESYYQRPSYVNSNRYQNTHIASVNKQQDQNVYVTNSRGEVEYYLTPNGVKVYLNNSS